MKSYTWEEIANASEETKKLIAEEYGEIGPFIVSIAPHMLLQASWAKLTREDWDKVHREVVEQYMLHRPDLPYKGEEKKP